MHRHLIRLASAPLISSRFGNVWLVQFPRASRGKHNAEFTKGENSDPILSRLWTKVHEIFTRCRKPRVLSNALFRLSVSRFFLQIFTIKSRSRRRTKCKSFLAPNFCGRVGSDFSTAPSLPQKLGRLTTHYLAKFG